MSFEKIIKYVSKIPVIIIRILIYMDGEIVCCFVVRSNACPAFVNYSLRTLSASFKFVAYERMRIVFLVDKTFNKCFMIFPVTEKTCSFHEFNESRT